MPKPMLYYLLLLGLISIFLTAYDKWAAKRRPDGRVPERTLLMLAALGGAAPMYVMMLLIRHKTRHKLFMIGLPVLVLLHIAALWWFSVNVFG